jgi:integrase
MSTKATSTKRTIPAVYPTKKGDFYCSFQNRKIYLGRNRTEAKRRARALVRDAAKKDAETPPPEPPQILPPAPLAKPRERKEPPTMAELILAYMPEAKNDRSHFASIRSALRIVVEKYGDTPAQDFGPIALKECRREMIARDLSRDYINKQVGHIIRLFKWAVENEILPEATVTRLEYVRNLKRGEARETKPREDVPDAEILKTLPHLLPTIRDMVILQRISGMRPSELFRMTLEQFVERGPDVWIYCPFYHKTKNHNKNRVIGFGRFEIEILQRHATGKTETEPLFSPRDTWTEHTDKRKIAPSENYMIGKWYTKDAYRKNITRTIERVNTELQNAGRPAGEMIQHWTPYQLRHAAATFLSLLLDQEAAAQALGHANKNTTKRYDHSAVQKMAQLIRERDEAGRAQLANFATEKTVIKQY